MAQYRIARYNSYQKNGFCVEYKGIFTLWLFWKPVRDLYGDIIVADSLKEAKHLIHCWTDKEQITALEQKDK